MKMENYLPSFLSLLIIVVSMRCCCGNILKDDELYMASCRRDLGMASGAIADGALTSSSSYDEKSVGPINARIRQEKNGGAWCPKLPISKEVKEWLQIDLEELKVVTLVETQGRFGNGQGQEYAPSYLLEYQRENSSKWIRYKDKKGTQVIRGNSNTYIAELRELRPPLIARRVRFYPWSNHPRMICLRVELYGCPWTDGVVSYGVRQGDRRGPDIDLADHTYDGRVEDGRLTDGLGQLTDLEEGTGNFRLDLTNQGRKGYEWVGWRNDTNASSSGSPSGSSSPLQIDFRFDRIRDFTGVRLHANNLFTRDVGVFRRVVVFFSLDGSTFLEGSPLVYDYTRDALFETARHVIIPIPHRIGLAVRMVFYFDLRWIMLSEIRFESEIFHGVVSDVSPSNGSSSAASGLPPPPPSPGDRFPSPLDPFPTSQGHVHGTATLTLSTPLTSAGAVTASLPSQYNVIVQGRGSAKVTMMTSKSSAADSVRPRHLVDSNERHASRLLDDAYLGVTVGVVVVFVVLATAVTVVVCRYRRRKYDGRSGLKSDLTTGVNRINFKLPLNAPSSTNGKFSKGNVYKSIATNEMAAELARATTVATGNRRVSTFCVKDGSYEDVSMETIPFYELPHVLPTAKPYCCEVVDPDLNLGMTKIQDYEGGHSVMSGRDGGEGGIGIGIGIGGQQRTFDCHSSFPSSSCQFPVEGKPDPALTLIPPLPPRRFIGARPTTSGSGNVQTPPDPEEDLGTGNGADPGVLEIQRSSLRFIEKLGEGQFRESYLCEVDGLVSSESEDNQSDCEGSPEEEEAMDGTKGRLVVVKVLKTHSSEQNRLDFYDEMDAALRLKDPNLVRVLGVCSSDPRLPAYVLEYPGQGDLHQFLLSRVPECPSVSGLKHGHSLSYGCLIYMATQVSSGMKYLESQNICHRDLAARNCVVGSHYSVKIVDFGVCRFSCSADYYRLERGDWVPLRWAAWEAVILNKFSCKSDVFSFGVTLWEILSLARHRPFQDLSDEQVVDVVFDRLRRDDTCVDEYLEQPTVCPKEIFDLTKECWNPREAKRPSFREIHMFLQQKNAGYDPREH